MQKRLIVRKMCSMVLGLSLVVSMSEFHGIRVMAQAEEAKADVSIQIDPENHSVFHDTDQDGWGEFQGWGTSLCWWANRVGYDETLTAQAAELFYNADTGLGMSIGRYNIGGGDDLSTHDSHITRSDSVVPGYAVDITKISSEDEAQGYDQYDLECGYAWNYDWDADANQLNVLQAAAAEAGEDFIAETFSNSPPAFMTNSGCTSGGENGAENLRTDCYMAFAKYLTDVTKHLVDMGIPVESMEGMNEPDSNWTANSPKQEGCVIWPGAAQSSVVTAMRQQMTAQGLTDVRLTASDESATNQALNSYNLLSQEAKNAVDRIDTHTYTFSKPADLRVLAEQEKKTLWMSEMDGTTTGGTNAGPMRAALGLGRNISSQVNSLLPAAWILWDAIDIHVDRENPFDKNTLEEVGYNTLDNNGFWGLAVADHNEKKVYLTKKYYAYGQYSRYIRPGYTMLTVAGDHVAAYDKKTETLVLVVDHTEAENQTYQFDLHRFGDIAEDADVDVIRTSGTLEEGENWSDLSQQGIVVLDPVQKQMTADVLGNSLTTYVIHGLSLPEEQEKESISVPENLPADSGLTVTFPDLFDGSFVSGYNRTKQLEEIVVDFGQNYELQELAFAACSKAEDSIEGGSILTSIDGKNWTELCRVDHLATSYYFNYIDPSMYQNKEAALCRYVKFKDDGAYVALSEVKFSGQRETKDPESPAPTSTAGEQQASPTPNAPAVQATKEPAVTKSPSKTEHKLGQVKIKSICSAKKKTVTIRWKKVNGAKGYRITYAADKTFRKGKRTMNVKDTSKVIKKLKRGKKYYFKIEAYRGKTYGKASKVKSIKVK